MQRTNALLLSAQAETVGAGGLSLVHAWLLLLLLLRLPALLLAMPGRAAARWASAR